MEKKINIAELLKDCPCDMELDCTMYDNLYFDSLSSYYNETINCYTLIDGIKTSICFTKYGTFNTHTNAKCVIFPKGKNTWDGFVPPVQFKDGDIVSTNDGNYIFIFEGGIVKESDFYKGKTHFAFCKRDNKILDNNTSWFFNRLSTEEEKQRLFNAIKYSGYKWNAENKTLEKLIEPKFKVGDVVINATYKDSNAFIYAGENDDYYYSYVGLDTDINPKLYTYESRTWVCKKSGIRFATEEEKAKLFQAIKNNGYKWNEETKTLEKLIEPSFHEGDWVTDGVSKCQIRFIDDTQYWYSENCILGSIESVDKQYHFWTINDAKDGDVLFHLDSASSGIFIFKEILQRGTIQKVICYCDYDSDDGFCLGENHTCCWTDSKILHPATKEQRDILFQKIREAGYIWNDETKTLEKLTELTESKEEVDEIVMSGIYFDREYYADEVELHLGNYEIEIRDDKTYAVFKNQETKTLKPKFKVGDRIEYINGKNKDGVKEGIILSITGDTYDVAVTNDMGIFIPIADQDSWDLVPNKFDITTLKPFDKVLVRDNDKQKWTIDYFSFVDKEQVYPFVCVGHYVSQCIPYEGNEHLLRTTNDCDEYYKTWQK